MHITVDLLNPMIQCCNLCRERQHCYPLSDDEEVCKHFCVMCISRLLSACLPAQSVNPGSAAARSGGYGASQLDPPLCEGEHCPATKRAKPFSVARRSSVRNLKRYAKRVFIVLLLIPALLVAPMGCGIETIPPLLEAVAVVSAVAFTIHQIQEIRSAELDIEMKQIKVHGLRNGVPVTLERQLSDAECQRIAEEGKVTINGKEIIISR
jgi:hypothetical protein